MSQYPCVDKRFHHRVDLNFCPSIFIPMPYAEKLQGTALVHFSRQVRPPINFSPLFVFGSFFLSTQQPNPELRYFVFSETHSCLHQLLKFAPLT